MNRILRSGLYAITPADPVSDLSRLVADVLVGGAAAVQYRDKSDDEERRADEARVLKTLCDTAEVPLIINDDVALAEQTGAGVHLGRDDMALSEARTQLGPERIIGVSCYDSLQRARDAVSGGANYVAFGSFFASPTKPEAVRVSIDLLKAAKEEIDIPIVAIGGITTDNASTLIAAGADLIAAVSAVFETDDPRRAAERFTGLFMTVRTEG